jgi:hypothetical protein
VCAALVAGLLVLTACDGSEKVASSEGAGSPAVKQTRHTAMGDASLDLELTLDHAEMTVAQRLDATLVITVRSSATITPPPTPASLGDFNVISSSTHETLEGARKELTQHFVLEPFLAGDKSFPSIEVLATDGSHQLSLKTEPVTIKVSPTAEADATAQTPLAPARAPVALLAPTPDHTARLVWIIAGTVVAMGSVGAGLVAAQRRRARIYNLPTNRVARDLDEVAKMLASDDREQAGRAAAALHEGLSRFLRDQFAIPAPTSTAAELEEALSGSTIPGPDRAPLSTLLTEIERVRFGPGGAPAPIVRQLLDRTQVWVQSVSHLPPATEAKA